MLHISLQDSSITFKIFKLIEGTLSSNCRSQILSSIVLMENPSWDSSSLPLCSIIIKDILTRYAICIDFLRWGFWIAIFLLLTIFISYVLNNWFLFFLNLVEMYPRKDSLWVCLSLLPVFNKILYYMTLCPLYPDSFFSSTFLYTAIWDF